MLISPPVELIRTVPKSGVTRSMNARPEPLTLVSMAFGSSSSFLMTSPVTGPAPSGQSLASRPAAWMSCAIVSKRSRSSKCAASVAGSRSTVASSRWTYTAGGGCVFVFACSSALAGRAIRAPPAPGNHAPIPLAPWLTSTQAIWF